MQPYEKYLKENSQKLRVDQTDAERKLWQRINRDQLLGFRFNRQKPLLSYIVDFYCAKAKLIIELDGSQHYEPDYQEKDALRDAELNSLGFTVMRFRYEAIPFFHIRTSKPVILSGMMPHIFHIGCTLQNWDSSLDLHPSDICYDIFHRRHKFFYCIPYGKCWLYSVVRRLLQVGTWLYRKTGRQTGSRLRLWSKYMLSQKTALPVLRVTPGAYLKVEFHLPAFLPGLQNCLQLPL